MNKYLFKSITVMMVLLITIVWCGIIKAEPNGDICDIGNTKIVFGYFNGVNTTEHDAQKAVEKMQYLYGDTLPSTGEHIRYENFYNMSQGLTVDVIEVAHQRFREQNDLLADRFELF